MFVELTSGTPTSDYTADVQAVVDNLHGTGISTLKELVDVEDVDFLSGYVLTDQQLADQLSGQLPWSDMTPAVRLATVTARRATLDTIRGA